MLVENKISTQEWDLVLNYLAPIVEKYGNQFIGHYSKLLRSNMNIN